MGNVTEKLVVLSKHVMFPVVPGFRHRTTTRWNTAIWYEVKNGKMYCRSDNSYNMLYVTDKLIIPTMHIKFPADPDCRHRTTTRGMQQAGMKSGKAQLNVVWSDNP